VRRAFLFSILVYFFGTAIIFPYVRYYADNPDTFQYLEIAKKYLAGDWQHAVNAYWSPLISWLLIPFLVFIKNELLAFKSLQLIIGMLTLIQWCNLIEKVPINNRWKKFLEFFSIPFLLNYALLNGTPDLLFVLLSLRLLNLTLSGRVFIEKKASIHLAITGALLYFTKAFGLSFFISWVILVFFFQRIIWKNKDTIIANLMALMIVFIFLCTPWILTLSKQQQKFSFSEAPVFNLSKEVALRENSELPILSIGLLKPSDNCKSAWETPGKFVSQKSVEFNSSEYLPLVEKNFLTIYYYDFRHQAGLFFLILFLVYLIRRGKKEFLESRWIIILLFYILLTYVGYSLVVVHTRYVWLNTWLMVLMSAYFLERIFGIEKRFVLSNVLFLGLVLLALKRPFKEIFFITDKNYPAHWMAKAAMHPFTTLWVNYKTDATLQREISIIHTEKIIHGNIASLKPAIMIAIHTLLR